MQTIQNCKDGIDDQAKAKGKQQRPPGTYILHIEIVIVCEAMLKMGMGGNLCPEAFFSNRGKNWDD